MRQSTQPVVELAKSHSSKPDTTPSPHSVAWQRTPGSGHDQPGSTVLHVASQPSPLTWLPSSQSSAPDTSRSPQATVEVHACPGTGQAKSCSSWAQLAAQPSPDSLLPSSQASPFCTTESPQPPMSSTPPASGFSGP